LYNTPLRESSARDIDIYVEKVLNDLGILEPPLDLAAVHELLKIDRKYYSSTDTGLLQDTVHKVRLGTKQILSKPSRILDVIREWDLKALYLPEQKLILIDNDLAQLKKRWAEAHEVGHSLIEWHESFMHGDQRVTLSVSCHDELEAEANYAAGRLIFLRDAFHDRLMSSAIDLHAVKALAELFGNTITTTLWRTVEVIDTPAIGIISCQPNDKNMDPVRHAVCSKAFGEQFGNTNATTLFQQLKNFCRRGGGDIGSSEICIEDIRGKKHIFYFECFHNSYDTLTLGVYREVATVRVFT